MKGCNSVRIPRDFFTTPHIHSACEDLLAYFQNSYVKSFPALFECMNKNTEDGYYYRTPSPTLQISTFTKHCDRSPRAHTHNLNNSAHSYPLIFYIGHTAAKYVQRLSETGYIPHDKMDQATHAYNALFIDSGNIPDWPTLPSVWKYRDTVRMHIEEIISSIRGKGRDSLLSVGKIVMECIEHEQHCWEVCYTLIRCLPLKFFGHEIDDFFKIAPHSNEKSITPENKLVAIQLREDEGVTGKCMSEHSVLLDTSMYLVSNGEYVAFVRDGGYTNPEYWCERGKALLASTGRKHPPYWIPSASVMSMHEESIDSTNLEVSLYQYRLANRLIPLPLDWPVEVTAEEANAFCRWKSTRDGMMYDLPTQDEWERLCVAALVPNTPTKLTVESFIHRANIRLRHFATPCSVSRFEQGPVFDVVGNVWQWVRTRSESPSAWQDAATLEPPTEVAYTVEGGSFSSLGDVLSEQSRALLQRYIHVTQDVANPLLLPLRSAAGFRYIARGASARYKQNHFDNDHSVSRNCWFHYCDPSPFLQIIELGITTSYAQSVAEHCIRLAQTHAVPTRKALDIGCGVGRTSLELAKVFDLVTGVDASKKMIDIARQIAQGVSISYNQLVEGSVATINKVQLDENHPDLFAVANKVEYFPMDACRLGEGAEGFDLILAADLLDVLYEPRQFLLSIQNCLQEHGLLIITSAYNWDEAYTPRSLWLGGYADSNFDPHTNTTSRVPVSTREQLENILGTHFTLVDEHEVPCTVQENARTFRHFVTQMTVWRKNRVGELERFLRKVRSTSSFSPRTSSGRLSSSKIMSGSVVTEDKVSPSPRSHTLHTHVIEGNVFLSSDSLVTSSSAEELVVREDVHESWNSTMPPTPHSTVGSFPHSNTLDENFRLRSQSPLLDNAIHRMQRSSSLRSLRSAERELLLRSQGSGWDGQFRVQEQNPTASTREPRNHTSSFGRNLYVDVPGEEHSGTHRSLTSRNGRGRTSFSGEYGYSWSPTSIRNGNRPALSSEVQHLGSDVGSSRRHTTSKDLDRAAKKAVYDVQNDTTSSSARSAVSRFAAHFDMMNDYDATPIDPHQFPHVATPPSSYEFANPYEDGMCHFSVPSFIVEAFQTHCASPMLLGTRKHAALEDKVKHALVDWMLHRHALRIDPSWIEIFSSIETALSLLIHTFTSPNDTIVVQTPANPLLLAVVNQTGRKLVTYPLICTIRGTYSMDLESLDALLSHDARVRLLILSSPHDPLGRIWSREELVALEAQCTAHGIYTIVDEQACDVVSHEGIHPFVSFTSLPTNVSDRTVVLTSPVKGFSLHGCCAIFALLRNPQLRFMVQEQYYQRHYTPMNMFSLVATEAAYRQGSEWIDALLGYVHHNRKQLHNCLIESHSPLRICPIHPEAGLEGLTTWLDCRPLMTARKMTSQAELDALLRNMKIPFLSGTIFGCDSGLGFVLVHLTVSNKNMSDEIAPRLAHLHEF